MAASGRVLQFLKVPFLQYNKWLERSPVTAKSVTSGVMYATGDLFAQIAENYRENKQGKAEGKPKKPLQVNWKRVGIFLVYGTVIAGPLYHLWFSRLDLLPAALFQLRQHRHRAEVLRAYALLKRHGIEVNLRVDRLPSATPFSKWAEKGIKIAADQLVFSSLYTLLFFVAVGMMTGGADKYIAEKRIEDLKDYEDLLHARHRERLQAAQAAASAGSATSAARAAMAQATAAADAETATMDAMLAFIREEQAKHDMPWSTIWDDVWRHTTDKYWETYAADCIVWPPLQLINFSFVPVQYQFLFVNTANLLWNTFLSLQANAHG